MPYQQANRRPPAPKVQYEIAGYNQDNSILLTPDIKFEAESGLYSPVVESVTISTNPEDKEVYSADRKKPHGKQRLHAKALERIGVAANVVWDVANCGPIHYVPGKECTYRAAGGIQKADGKIEMIAQYFEYNMAVVREDLEAQYPDKKDHWKIDRDFRQKRKFMVPYCESMARARVIRKLLNIKQEYTREELAKPFVLIRFRLNIDFNDPAIKHLAASAHIMASVGIFGQPPQAALPAPRAPILTSAEAAALADTQDGPNHDHAGHPEPSVPPPAGQPMTKAFFESLQRPDQESELYKLMKIKGYDAGQLKMALADFSDIHILGFFEKLSAMPDADQAPYEGAPS